MALPAGSPLSPFTPSDSSTGPPTGTPTSPDPGTAPSFSAPRCPMSPLKRVRRWLNIVNPRLADTIPDEEEEEEEEDG